MSQPIDPRTLEVLADVSTSVKKVGDPNLTTLTSGVVLRHKKIPPMILAKVEEKYVEPPVPTVYDENSDRHIPNPDDPNYAKALEDLQTQKGNALVDVLIALGTEIESIPDGLQKPENEEWVEELSFLGIEVPKLKVGRYLSWVKYYAAQSVEDFKNLAERGAKALGVTEVAVATAIAGFQSDETRQTNPEYPTEI